MTLLTSPCSPRLGRLCLMLCLLLAACGPVSTALPAATPAPITTPVPVRVTATAPAATQPPPNPAATPVALDTQQELLDAMAAITAAPPAEAQAQADALWQALVSSRREPLIYDTEVYFFYKGQAQSVDWRGGFNQWSTPGLVGIRVGTTDLWMAQFPMPAASRAEYEIAVDDQPLRGDAANPLTQATGLTTTNSLLVMPGFSVSDEGQRRAGVAPGTVSAPLSITSQQLGYVVNYWVYTPAGYDPQAVARLPTLYLQDGETFLRDWRGALPIILDNLIAAGRIPPVLAVFVDEREPANPQHNRREEEFIAHPVEHALFLAEELVPAIDRAYRTDPRAAARVIAGVSYGGLSATFIGLTQSDTFQNVAAFSPSLRALDYPEMQPNLQQATGIRLMQLAIGSVTGCSETCPRLPLKIFMTSGIPNWDVGDLSPVVSNLLRQGYPVSFQQAGEAHTWSQWRGLSDEMLVYFFGAQ